MQETGGRFAPFALIICGALSAPACASSAARAGASTSGSEAASSDESGAEAGLNEPSRDTGANGNGSSHDSVTDGPGDVLAAPMETDATVPSEASAEEEAEAGDAYAAVEGAAPVDGSVDSSDTQPIPIVGMVQPCAMPFASGTTLLDLGHAQPIAVLKQSGNRVLSEDMSGHWILWDTSSRSQVASGDADLLPTAGGGLNLALSPNVGSNLLEQSFGSFALDMAAGTIAVPTLTSVTLLSSVDGHAMRTIPLPASLVGGGNEAYGLATDGSYLWAMTASSLNAWSTSGKMLVNLSGDYSNGVIFAAPTELQVGESPQMNGNNAFELVSVSTGLPTKTQVLNDRFESWFNDGSRFMTASRQGSATTVTVYSAAGVKQSAQVLPFTAMGLVGQGGYFWTMDAGFGSTLQVFAAGGGTIPAWVDPSSSQIVGTPMGAGNLLAFKDSASGLDILDLSGPAVTESTVPFAGNADSFDADLAAHWAVSSGSLVFDSADATGAGGPAPLDCGEAFSIAGAATGRVAISTEAGQILYFDLQSTPRALVGSLGFAADKLAMSSDGTVLAAAMLSAGPLRVFELPSGANPMTWTYAGGTNGPFLSDFSLSRGGTTIGQITEVTDNSARTHRFTRTLAEAPTWSTSLTDALVLPLSSSGNLPSIALSPNGVFAAVSDFPSFPQVGNATTNIFNGGRLVGTAPGYPFGWMDDERLLVQTYQSNADDPGFGNGSYLGSSVCNPQGAVTALVALPEINRFTPVGTNQVYGPDNFTIYNLTDGSVAWTSPVLGLSSDLAGGSLVLATDHRVIVEAYP